MTAIVDHVFICCSAGGSEADALTRLGLKEGSANTHPGQGTACRRFFFANAYLELLWVGDALEARSETVLPTRLWERWSKRGEDACPYGIVLRPADDTTDVSAPFASWSYEPQYVPPGLAIDIARSTPLAGPEFFYGPPAWWPFTMPTTTCWNCGSTMRTGAVRTSGPRCPSP